MKNWYQTTLQKLIVLQNLSFYVNELSHLKESYLTGLFLYSLEGLCLV